MTTDAGAAGAEQGQGQGAQGQGAAQGGAPAADPWADPETARSTIEALRRENAGWRTKVRDLEPLAARATAADEAAKTETQRLTEQLTAAQKQATEAQASALRFQVAADKGLPATIAARLQGSTLEELTADAEQLVTLLGGAGAQQQGGRPAVDLRQGARGTAPVTGEPDLNNWVRDLARSRGSGKLPQR